MEGIEEELSAIKSTNERALQREFESFARRETTQRTKDELESTLYTKFDVHKKRRHNVHG